MPTNDVWKSDFRMPRELRIGKRFRRWRTYSRYVRVRAATMLRGKSRIPGFVHVPKTGGTHLARWHADEAPVLWPVRYFAHAYVVGDDGATAPAGMDFQPAFHKSLVKPYFVFSSVRNPFDWLVSYAGHAGGWTERYRNPDHPDYDIANKPFTEFIRILSERTDRWPGRKLIHAQMWTSDGEFLPRWINRIETLDDDAEAMAHELGCRFRRRERARVGERDRDYRAYYDDTTREIVERTWRRELKLFGYGFDGPTGETLTGDDNSEMSRRLDPPFRDNLRYVWATDTLTLGGETID